MQQDEATQLLTAERKRLETLRAQASTGLEDSQEARQAELSSYDQHPADATQGLQEREVSQTLVERFDAQLQAVEVAFSRLDEGTYGLCEHCGQPIPDERLREQPAARYCVDHEPPEEGLSEA